jgi:hypothetical protein
MKKQMINRPIILFARPTPINQNHVSLPQIVQSENLAKSGQPNEESHPRRNFSMPYALLRKGSANIQNKNVVEGTHLKLPLLIQNPPNFVSLATQLIGVKETIERS